MGVMRIGFHGDPHLAVSCRHWQEIEKSPPCLLLLSRPPPPLPSAVPDLSPPCRRHR